MDVLFLALVCLFIYMCGAYYIAVRKKNNGIADIAWGGGFVVVAVVTFLFGDFGFTGTLATLLTIIWAARLSTRVYSRNRDKPEDYRYAAMREKWEKEGEKKGKKNTVAVNSFWQVFMLQGLILFFVVTPVSLVNTFGGGSIFSVIGLLGLIVWIKGFVFESVGDHQLSKFLSDPTNKGKIMDKGLWKYTRHPNYYGESLQWWGLGLIAFGRLVEVVPILLALCAFIGPIVITYMLLKVSGVPLLEARFAGNPAWEEYKKKTSVFIPWFPKKQ